MGTTVDGSKRTNSRYRAYDGPGFGRDPGGNYGGKFPGFSGSHDRPVEGQRKQAVELCDVPDRPFQRYFTPINYDDEQVGVIRLTRGTWRATIGRHEYGPFKTFLGARTFVYRWFSGLDIDPGEMPDMPGA